MATIVPLILQPGAEDLFRHTRPIDIRAVEEVDAAVDGDVEHAVCLIAIRPVAECHCPETDLGDAEVGTAEMTEAHLCPLTRQSAVILGGPEGSGDEGGPVGTQN